MLNTTYLNSNLTEGLPVIYENVSYSTEGTDSYGATVTTEKIEYSTQQGRKFSDYQYLNFELLINKSVRATMLVPINRFVEQGYTVELTYVDSANVQRWIAVIYKTDTSFYMQGSSNIIQNYTKVQITGLKAKIWN